MKVKELIEKLSKYDPEHRVLLYSHGRCSAEEQNEILGCYEEEIRNDDDEFLETAVILYEY